MDNLEKMLKDKKNELDKLEIPEEMEFKLKNSLDNIPNRKRKFNVKVKVASLVIAVLIIGFNVDSLAYYGKQLIGYENIMDGTLMELNKLDKGQIIDKSYILKNGTEVILDGVMLDDNNLVAFYRIKTLTGDIENGQNNVRVNMEDKFGKTYTGGGSGLISPDSTEINWIMTYEKPKFFKKNMILKIYSNDSNEIGEIDFKLDRNKAMGHTLKVNINKDIEVDQKRIKLESLMASPISTVIKGKIQDTMDFLIEEIKGERFMFETIGLSLIVDGQEVPVKSSSISSDIKESKFDITFDALPKDGKEIEIRLNSFGGNHDVKEKLGLTKGDINKKIQILDQDISINKVYESEGNTYVNITTNEDLVLSRVFLSIDGEKIEVEKTLPGTDEKIVYYDEIAKEDKVAIKHNRTIEFKGVGEELELDIQRIRYKKTYDDIIYKHSVK